MNEVYRHFLLEKGFQMKRTYSMVKNILISLCFLSILSACIGNQGGNGARASQTGEGGNLPTPIRLAVGTLSLDKAGKGVDAAQAKELLPLWKGILMLATSDSASPQEMNALYKQVRSTMKPEQITIIDAISREDVRAIAQQTGMESAVNFLGGGQPRQGGSGTGSGNGTRTSGGGGPGGGPGFPGDGPPGGPGGGTSSSQRSSSTQSLSAFTKALYKLVIELLASKAR
jgi:hypothetical protein